MDIHRFPYDEIRRRVEARFKRRRPFVFSLIVCLLASILAALYSLELGLLILVLLTFMLLLPQGVSLLMFEWQERVIDRETERRWQQYLAALPYLEKPKREEESFAHLTDDGELADEYADLKQKRVR